MTSTFRLTRAEFKKIFKRASVYIMALLLVVAVLVSMYIFKPVANEDKTIDYGENLTVENYYDYFYNKDLNTTKKGLDQEYYSNSDNIYNYFYISSERDLKLSQNYNDFVNTYNQMKNISDSSLLNAKYAELKLTLEDFYNNFKDFSMFDITIYPHIEYSTESFIDNSGTNYYIATYSANIKNLYEKTKDVSINASDFLKIIETNNYVEKLKEDLNAGINYIRPTLYSMAIDIKDSYSEFNNAYSKGSQAPALASMENYRKELKTAVTNFKNYFDCVVNNDFIIATITKDKKIEITNTIDSALESLGASVFNGTTKTYSDYSSLQTSLTNLDIANYFTKTFSEDKDYFSQVKLKSTTIDEFSKIKTKVDKNKIDIENEIKNHLTDESIKNIQNLITNYKLLGETYLNYLTNKIKVSLHTSYRSDELVTLYGYKLDEFNIYETQENIIKYKYYIDNNTYENSFNDNYVFMQTSNENPNAFEFMYFAMEICTVLIIIFAMMMMCNLITSETESGTIKLLLTRPYKRSKVLTAKLFATIIFSFIFVIFSALISFAGGYFVYGLDMTNILVIFNSTTAMSLSPIALMLINIASLFLDVLFYILIALMISILFKNYAGSISFSLFIILATLGLNVLFGSSFWYSLLPGTNLHLFKYFGNSFMASTTNIFQSILITPVQSTMNFWYSLLILGAYSIVSIAISYAVFNKRDF